MEIRAVNLQTGITAVRESRPLGMVGAGMAEKQVRVTVSNGYDYEIRPVLVANTAPSSTSRIRIS